MPALGEAVVVIVVTVLVILLLLRILISFPGWVRRVRRPEARAIRVIGVGGGGSNAVDRMVGARTQAVSFVACNTDAQALRHSTADTKIRIGDGITRGLGSGGDPEVGRRAAEADKERITHAVAGADLVFVTAGLGGGTGSGAAPIVAAIAREQGALTIAVVTKPFGFEGTQRKRVADHAAVELAASVDAMIVVPNDRISAVLAEDVSLVDAFRAVDDVLLQAVQGIIDLIAAPGLINLDFADVRSVMESAGPALIGLGRGTGAQRATDAARQALTSPLLEASIDGARGILFNVSGPADLRLAEVRAAAEAIRERADPDAKIIFGASFSTAAGEDAVITLIATGVRADAGRTAVPVVRSSTEGRRPPLTATDRPTRPVRATPSKVDVPQSANHGDAAPQHAPALDEAELEVPSFLRRGPQPTRRS